MNEAPQSEPIRFDPSGDESRIGQFVDYLIAYHWDFFLPFRRTWEERTDEATRNMVYQMDHAIMEHWVAGQAQAIAQKNLSPLQCIQACISVIARSIISQRKMHIHLVEDELRRIDFRYTGFSRVLRGLTNCEGINYVLLQLLEKLGVSAEMYEAVDADGSAQHNFLKVETDEGWCFADAWARHGIYYVDGLCPNSVMPNIAELETLESTTPIADGILPRHMYLNGCAPQLRALHLSTLADNWRPPTHSTGPINKPWQAFLEVRKAHLFDSGGNESDYRSLLKAHRFGGITGQLIENLINLSQDGQDHGDHRTRSQSKDRG